MLGRIVGPSPRSGPRIERKGSYEQLKMFAMPPFFCPTQSGRKRFPPRRSVVAPPRLLGQGLKVRLRGRQPIMIRVLQSSILIMGPFSCFPRQPRVRLTQTPRATPVSQEALLVSSRLPDRVSRYWRGRRISNLTWHRTPRSRIGFLESVAASLVGEVDGRPRIISATVESPLIVAAIHLRDHFATMIADDGGRCRTCHPRRCVRAWVSHARLAARTTSTRKPDAPANGPARRAPASIVPGSAAAAAGGGVMRAGARESRTIDTVKPTANARWLAPTRTVPQGPAAQSISHAQAQKASGNTGMTGSTLTPRRCPTGMPWRASSASRVGPPLRQPTGTRRGRRTTGGPRRHR